MKHKFQHDFDRSFRFKINNIFWECYLITREESVEVDEIVLSYNDDHVPGVEFPGMTLPYKKTMFIVESHVNKNIIGHELFHAIVDSFNIGSADLTNDQFEEVIADYLGYNVENFIKLRNKLYKKFVKLEEMGRKK